MDNKKVVAKDKVFKRAITLCWILLGLCFVIKIFGGNFFNIICKNEKFIKVCEFVDNYFILKLIIGTISSLITYSLFYLAILHKINFNKLEWLIMGITTPLFVALRILFIKLNINIVLFVINCVQFFIMPFVFKRGNVVKLNRWFVPVYILGNILNLIFQIISALVKNVDIVMNIDNTLLGFIFTIDIFIMLGLYYLYSNNKKGGKKMGWIASWFFGKSTEQLKKMKKTRENKIAKIQAEIDAINEELAKKENESKN